uniref:hypothetical protein n=1 Tax=Endozoicomonas sp. SESOKO1 TaxID=2828742 RepID=UPI0021497EBD
FGQPVIPDAVVRAFPDSPAGKLGRARFKEQCCLRGLPLNDQQVTPDSVVKDYQAVKAILELARFKQQCCLLGLPLNGRYITPEAVVKAFPDSPEGKLGIARFKEQCCLRGLPLNGQQVTPDAVVRDFPDNPESELGRARFKAKCCLRGLPLNGQQVTPDAVVRDFPDSPEGKLTMARFKEECCLRGLPLNGQQVTPDAVVRDFPDSPEGKLGSTRFKEQCCLKGLLLNGQQVTPEVLVKDYECGGWLLEKAIFYTQLALNARVLNGNYLNNRQVLESFKAVPGNYSSRQAEYLMQRLEIPQWYDETSEAQHTIQEAWQILNNAVATDEQRRLQCILKFMAMQNELTIDHQEVSAEQVFQSIKTLRCSFQNSRIQFFFLAHCYITRQSIDRRKIHKDQVLEYLQRFPEESKLHHALYCWFEQCRCEVNEVNIVDELLFKQAIPLAPGRDSSSRYQVPVREGPLPGQVREYRDKTENTPTTQAVTACAAQTLEPVSKIGEPDLPGHQVQRLNALTLRALQIIQEINDSCTAPPILITGSYARYLQNLCSSFNDIDIICATEAAARTLFQKLQALNTDSDCEIPKSIIIRAIPGCQMIRLPNTYNIQLKDGDLGRKAMGLQVTVDARITRENEAPLAIHVPGVESPVRYLSFTEETRLLNDTLKYLGDNLGPLTEQLQTGAVFNVPRTILFNTPKNTGERVYGLLMRCLLTLNKARQFIAQHSQQTAGKPQSRTHLLQEQRLSALTENLHMKLAGHVCRHDFEHRVKDWLSTTQPVHDYQVNRKEFIKTLLAMMHA